MTRVFIVCACALLSAPAVAVSKANKIQIEQTVNQPEDGVSHFSITIPVAALRFDDGTHVSGPLPPLGIGLGWSYVSGPRGGSLAPVFTAYLFSEKLDLENDYQLAIGATVGLRLMESASIGVGINFDLIRAKRGADGALVTTNFPFNGTLHQSVTWVMAIHWLL